MHRPRIGLTQRVEIVREYGERRDCLDQAWTSLLEDLGLLPIPLVNGTGDPEAYLAAMNLDGLILTGGNDLACLPRPTRPAPERDRLERAGLALARRHGWPVLGVCRGMQMMVVESGGRLLAVEGHAGRPHALTLHAGVLPLGPGEVNSFHDYGVGAADLPAGWRIAARAPDGTVESVAHVDWPQVGVMWHPERAPHRGSDRELIRRHFVPPGEVVR